MPLFFTVTPEPQRHNAYPNAPTQEIGFQTAANQQAEAKGHKRTTAKLVFSTHEKHLLHKAMQEVAQYYIYIIS